MIFRAATMTFAFAFVGAGCTRKGSDEAAMLIAAVERVRTAPNEKKAETVPTLEAVPCGDPALCETKKECVVFAKRTVEGLALKADVERTLADVKAGKIAAESEAAMGLYAKLDESAKALKEGEAALLRCDERVQQLKRSAAR